MQSRWDGDDFTDTMQLRSNTKAQNAKEQRLITDAARRSPTSIQWLFSERAKAHQQAYAQHLRQERQRGRQLEPTLHSSLPSPARKHKAGERSLQRILSARARGGTLIRLRAAHRMLSLLHHLLFFCDWTGQIHRIPLW